VVVPLNNVIFEAAYTHLKYFFIRVSFKMTFISTMNVVKMVDCDSIFRSNFLIETMCNIMPTVDLHKFRHINKTIYNTMTSDRIHKKITKLICIRSEKVFGETYQQFLNIMKKINIQIYGPFINPFAIQNFLAKKIPFWKVEHLNCYLLCSSMSCCYILCSTVRP
jgi:hypothetical protein